MRSRGLILSFVLLALVGASCSSALPDEPAVSRAVGDEGPNWDAEQAILRTEILEANMDNGLTRTQSACMIDALATDEEYALEDIEGIDFTTQTGPPLEGDALPSALADALIDCGPSLRAKLRVDIPGALLIPATHGVESECVVNGYVEAWRTEYTLAYTDSPLADDEPLEPTVADKIVGIVNGCEAGGAIILGASGDGHPETAALSTLEWICLEDELDADQFMPAFPFPEEAGDALDRLGAGVAEPTQFCRDWVGASTDQERAEVEAAYR